MISKCYVQGLIEFELGRNFRTSGKHIELILTIVPFGQINGRMLELEKPVIYDP